MAEEATRQICGNCGAPNDPGAVICTVCGAVLSAYAQPQTPVPSPPTTTTLAPIATTTPAPVSATGNDWRSMFDTKTKPPQDLDFDDRDERPAPTTTPVPRRVTTTPPPTTPPPTTTPAPVRPQAQARPAAPRTETTTPRPARARPAPWERPKADPRFNRRRPQGMIAIGLLLLLLGCFVTGILAAVGADEAAILVFLCLTSIGFIAIVAAIVIWISRKEGRGG